MNIFEQLVIPPSQDHVGLLIVMQIISLLTFLPFAGIMLGGSVFSVYFNSRGKRTGNETYIRLAKELVDRLTVSKSAGYALGILPLATIVFIYAQMLYGAQVISVSLLFLTLILYIVSFLFLYNYKSTFHIETIIDAARKKGNELPDEVEEFDKKLKASNSRYGTYGIYAILTASFLFVGSTTIASDPASWSSVDNILKLLISGSIWINYLYFLSASFAFTGGAVLYFFFVWQGGINREDKELSKKAQSLAVSSALIGSVMLPVFLFFKILLMPGASLSASVFVYAGFTMAAVLLVCNFLYFIYKNSDVRYSGIVFFLMFALITFSVVKDQLAFKNAIKDHLLVVTAKAEELEKEKSSLIVQVSGADGEKIYNEKCIACHKFDVKLVGPPYQETIPKYNGDIKKLAQFIYNPQKIDPSYPPMPNQGLKLKEAEAVAKYLMDKISGK